jgi:hypothetical protein
MNFENKNDKSYSMIEGLHGIIASLRSLIDEYDLEVKKVSELILEIARRLNEGKACEEGKICREIKKILKDKIEQGKITEKWIEECLPPEYKRKYTKSEQSSLSKKVQEESQPQIAMTTDGKSASYDEPISITKASTINESTSANVAEKIPSHRSDQQIHPGKECSGCEELYEENQELKEVIRRNTVLKTADQTQETESKITISKEKYQMLRDAMDKSKDSICITCDESRTFVRAQPDVYN